MNRGRMACKELKLMEEEVYSWAEPLEMICDLAQGYDGFESPEDLKQLIDEIRGIAERGLKIKKSVKSTKPTIEFVRSEFEKEGYTLLTEKYKNRSTYLEFICPKGHGRSMTWNDWKHGRRCGICYRENQKVVGN